MSRIPAFNAERSLYAAAGHYRTGSGKHRNGTGTGSQVLPQADWGCYLQCAICAEAGALGAFEQLAQCAGCYLCMQQG
jgi:hypothetical protein